jgi:hypothetical protein
VSALYVSRFQLITWDSVKQGILREFAKENRVFKDLGQNYRGSCSRWNRFVSEIDFRDSGCPALVVHALFTETCWLISHFTIFFQPLSKSNMLP